MKGFSIRANELYQLLNRVKAVECDDFYVTGDSLILPEDSLKGHGIIEFNGQHYATLTGRLTTLNNYHYIANSNSAYVPCIGDKVIGIISAVDNTRWVVEISALQPAYLHPQCLLLDSGEQRCKTDSECTDLRNLFVEGDVIFAEVQKVYNDGNCVLHTRTMVYGKLEQGYLIRAQPQLATRLKEHVIIVNNLIQVIIGTNGYIWLSKPFANTTVDSQINDQSISKELTPLDTRDFEICARVRNIISLMLKFRISLRKEILLSLYEDSISLGLRPVELLEPKNYIKLIRRLCKAT